MTARFRRLAAGILALCLAAGGPLVSKAEAQYFGGNKVQYRTFDFQVLPTDHFDVYFYPEIEEAAELSARLAERWYERLSRIFQYRLPDRQPLIFYGSHPHFQQTNVIQGRIGEGTGGVTEAFKRRVVMPMGSSLGETDHVLGHELVHAFQFDLTARGRAAGNGGFPGVLRLPLWFVEGMAEYLSIGPVDPNTAMWVRDAMRQDELPRVRDLDHPRYFPYRWGQALWSYIGGRWGDEVVGPILLAAGQSGSAQIGIESVLELPLDELSEDWHAAIRAEYGAFAEAGQAAAQVGTLVVGGPEFGQELNVSPAVSPDGEYLLFFSSRELISVDLYLAEARTGEIIERIVDVAVDPHFSSLQFIRSAGAWAPDSSRFVFAGVSRGAPVLAIYDVASRSIEQETRFEELGEILNPAWSPDGRTIVFAAITGGMSNLHLYDVETAERRALTSDIFSALHPTWSPDGRTIAFITERFTSDMDTLEIGPLQVALVDVEDGSVRPAMPPGRDQQTNPQWGPEGASLFFVSDRTGIFNLHRLDAASGEVVQATALATGISGIAPLSPAVSVASGTGDVFFTAFEEGRHAIYSITPETARAQVTPDAAMVAHNPAILPPRERRREPLDVVALLDDPTLGLPVTLPEPPRPYRAGLSLDHIGQPTLVAGMDTFGRFVGGGVSFIFSDMLGDHTLATAVETGAYFGGGFTDSLRNTTAGIAYQNLRRRWNWGVAAEQYPFFSGFFEAGLVPVDGQLVGLERTTILRQTNRAVSGLTAYPFSEAQRVEFSGGYQHVSFDRIVTEQFFSPGTGAFLGEDVRVTSIGDPLHLGRASAALVWDTSVFGATSPITGQRYRVEVAPVTGTINFTSGLADYRRYFMPATLYTIAGRVMHFGRYGPDSEDPRLTPLFLGYPGLVRGYEVGSFRVSECRPTPGAPTTDCPVFDRLLGSRLLIANLEFRFPLLRPFGLGAGLYGPVPVEVAFFGDAGVAWDSNDRPTVFGGDRRPVSSAGVAFRINTFGFAILELAAVHPFDRPERGWLFQFNLVPGF